MIKARAQVVFGDFNKRAYRNIHNEEDRANNVMKHWLEVAFRSCGGEVEFSMLRADVGTCLGQQILACGAEDDTMLHFLLDYKDVDFKIRKQRISQSAAPLDNASLRETFGEPSGNLWATFGKPIWYQFDANLIPNWHQSDTEYSE